MSTSQRWCWASNSEKALVILNLSQGKGEALHKCEAGTDTNTMVNIPSNASPASLVEVPDGGFIITIQDWHVLQMVIDILTEWEIVGIHDGIQGAVLAFASFGPS